jgi:AcrR family transcriptional regulator
MSEVWPYESLGQPRPRSDGALSRRTILQAAASLATVDGLEGVSFAGLALAIGMRRAELRAMFGSEQELQLAIVDEAARIFTEEVVQPALAAPPGLPQLTAVCEAFFAYLERGTFPGGCLMTSVALELGPGSGPVRDLIAGFQSRFGALIRDFVAAALAREELAPGEDPERLAFELNGIMLATDTNFVEHDDPAVLDLARQIVRSRLGARGG